MPSVIPMINGSESGLGYGVADQTARRMPSGDTGGPPVGAGNLTSSYNTPIHCAAFILVALAVIFALKLGGFRFAFDVGMGRT